MQFTVAIFFGEKHCVAMSGVSKLRILGSKHEQTDIIPYMVSLNLRG
jgi:hypothetical protein